MPKSFTFEFTEQDVNVLAKALSALSLGEALNTFMRFQQQVSAQAMVQTPAQVAAEQASDKVN